MEYDFPQIWPDSQVIIWKIQEPPSFFESVLMPLNKEQQKEFDKRHPRHRIEWLASRYLMRRFWVEPVQKDNYGKPKLIGSQDYISLSHSQQFTGIVRAARPVGIDIQAIVPKMRRIGPKIMHDDEQLTSTTSEEAQLTHAHIHWGVKEALYKAYGQRGLDAKKEMRLLPFKLGSSGRGRAWVSKADYYCEFDFFYKVQEGYMFCLVQARL